MADGMRFKNAPKSKEILGVGLDQDIFYSWVSSTVAHAVNVRNVSLSTDVYSVANANGIACEMGNGCVVRTGLCA